VYVDAEIAQKRLRLFTQELAANFVMGRAGAFEQKDRSAVASKLEREGSAGKTAADSDERRLLHR
jgi:hypothetical protein